MKSYKSLILLVFILFAFKQDNQPPFAKVKFKLPAGVTAKDYLPNTLIIKFNETSKAGVLAKGTKEALVVEGISFSALTPIFKEEPKNSKAFGTQQSGLNFGNYYYAKYSGNVGIDKVINTLLQNKDIAYAEPSYIYSTWYTPNDAAYSTQFYLSQVKAPQAWDIARNAADVIIGIVDTGSEITHQDLAANIYYNTADPVNGIDDDGDGYVDNYAGWDLCGASISTMIGDNDPNVKSSGADHGVHVSGIASAVTNNGIGVASLAGNAK
ncbi:S8 family serine peptidase, partial [Pedobacter sp.]